MMTRLNRDDQTHEELSRASEVMLRFDIPIIDIHSWMMSFDLDERSIPDGVHFCHELQELQASFLSGALSILSR